MSGLHLSVTVPPLYARGVRISAAAKLGLILALGLLVRLPFLPAAGFDTHTFELWARALASHPLDQFYRLPLIDYPPGYLYVLAAAGHAAASFPGSAHWLLRYLVKAPAISADLAGGILLYAIVQRFADRRWALGAAALFVFNPAAIFISAWWGQMDSVCAAFALLAVYLLLRCNEESARTISRHIVWAWVALAYSILVKPQAAILVVLFVAFAVATASREQRTMRLRSTAAGMACGILLAFVLTWPFYPSHNPESVLHFLYNRYRIGSAMYPFNSDNAFNLWSLRYDFWGADPAGVRLADYQTGLLGMTQYAWGIVLLLGTIAAIVVRYLRLRTAPAFLQSAALLLLAQFMLATRMHERYLFVGLIFTIALIPLALRYRWACAVFSGTLLLNLLYSLAYLAVLDNGAGAGVNRYDLWGPWAHALSAVNVGAFLYLVGAFVTSANVRAVLVSNTATCSTTSIRS